MEAKKHMGQNNLNIHLAKVENLMKGQPFWKVALFGIENPFNQENSLPFGVERLPQSIDCFLAAKQEDYYAKNLY